MLYPYLITGLPDIHLDDKKLNVDLLSLFSNLDEVLSSADLLLIKLLKAEYDNYNLLRVLEKKEMSHADLGNFSEEDLKEIIQMIQEEDQSQDKRILPYFKPFVEAFIQEQNLLDISWEDWLSTLYYSYVLNSSNRFLSKWFEFNLNLNNIIVAQTAMKHSFEIAPLIVGDNDVANTLRKSKSRDFGLAGTLEDLELFLNIANEDNLFEREKKIKQLKWDWLEENGTFYSFSIEKVIEYILKLQIVQRKLALDAEAGNKIFQELIQQLTSKI